MNKFLFSDLFWALLTMIGIFIASFFQEYEESYYFLYSFSAIFIFFLIKGVYAVFNRKE